MSKQEPTEIKAIRVPLEWYVPDTLVARLATNLVVQHTEHEFIISFFEVIPPILLGSEEEKEAKLESVSSVRATCVARVIVSADRMPDFVDAFQRNLETYRSTYPKEGAEK